MFLGMKQSVSFAFAALARDSFLMVFVVLHVIMTLSVAQRDALNDYCTAKSGVTLAGKVSTCSGIGADFKYVSSSLKPRTPKHPFICP